MSPDDRARHEVAAAPAPLGAYPHARRVGSLLFLSGVGPRQPGTNVIPDTFAGQVHAVFRNVRTILEAAGARWDDLVDVTVYLTDMSAHFPIYNAIYADYFTTNQPCRTTLGITALPTPIAIELKCIAAVEPERH